jgi:hypothetical protein
VLHPMITRLGPPGTKVASVSIMSMSLPPMNEARLNEARPASARPAAARTADDAAVAALASTIHRELRESLSPEDVVRLATALLGLVADELRARPR